MRFALCALLMASTALAGDCGAPDDCYYRPIWRNVRIKNKIVIAAPPNASVVSSVPAAMLPVGVNAGLGAGFGASGDFGSFGLGYQFGLMQSKNRENFGASEDKESRYGTKSSSSSREDLSELRGEIESLREATEELADIVKGIDERLDAQEEELNKKADKPATSNRSRESTTKEKLASVKSKTTRRVSSR